MEIYIVVFCTATLIFRLADFVKQKQRFYIDIVAIILLCLIAGFRAKTVGTDTRLYIRPMIDAAISSNNIVEYMQHRWWMGWTFLRPSDYEIGYVLAVYLISALFKSVVATQFFLELLIVLPTYFAIRKTKDIPVWFGMLVFMIYFFGSSMNIIRQSIAMAFVLLGTVFWMQKEKRKSIVSLIAAILFHTSALVGILIILFYEYAKIEREKTIQIGNKIIHIRAVNAALIILVGVLVLFGIDIVVYIMTKMTVLSKYVGYIAGDIRFMPNQVLIVLLPFIMLLFAVRQPGARSKELIFYIVKIAYVMITGQFSSANSFGGRVGLYFKIFSVLAYPMACKLGRHRKLSTLLMVSYLVFYWWFYYVLRGIDEIIPYARI